MLSEGELCADRSFVHSSQYAGIAEICAEQWALWCILDRNKPVLGR